MKTSTAIKKAMMILLIIFVTVVVTNFIIKKIIENKEKEPPVYSGSVVGTYVYSHGEYKSYVVLNNDQTCESFSVLGSHGSNCTYSRTNGKIIVSYDTQNGNASFTYLILSNGNLKQTVTEDIYYKQ